MNHQHSEPLPFPDFASSVLEPDPASLAGLSNDEIRPSTQTILEEHRLHYYTILYLHNAAAPIHTLPTELLVKIFGQTWQDRRSVHLTSVCRRWRSVYLSTPQFWAAGMAGSKDVRSVTVPSEHVAALLERSSPCLIHTEVLGPESPDVPDPMSALPVELSVHSHRVSSLSICMQSTRPVLDNLPRLLETSTPALETLHIYCGHEKAQLGRIDLTSLPRFPEINLPHLYEVFISPAELFPLFTARSLRRVSLSGSDPYARVISPDPMVLLQALRSCPNLETLHFGNYAIPDEWPVTGRVAVIHLPSLKERGIVETSNTSICAMLDALSVPPTALIQVAGVDNTSVADLVPCHLFRSRPFDKFSLRTDRHSWWILKCFVNHSRQVWELRLDGASLRGVLLLNYFQGMHVTHLEVLNQWCITWWNATPCTVENWVVVLPALPHLTSLTVCGATGPNSILPALAQYTISSDAPSTHLPCPALQAVVLCWRVAARGKNPGEPTNLPEGCDKATCASWDAEEHIRWRCSTMQPVFEQRALKAAPSLKTLGFWEYETDSSWPEDAMKHGGVRIPSTCRDDRSSACLARLRGVVGGPVVYGGYLLGKASDDQ
ncbi:hypothetical protein BD310DRAFT_951751 [Dichomitus squalens]|uniref:F-box domain-containing protein n=1 Tax=Dichomitus squalens TaxID=114155 RepID=A0A4Q9PIP6_9APHY|nr:hypothetical protein BD310DRAFT_951751 [Dichomitus squalens]